MNGLKLASFPCVSMECFFFQLNPAILDNPSEGPTNTEHLLSLLNDVVQNIFRATERCPL